MKVVATRLEDLIKAISCDQNQRWLNKIDESFSMSFFSTSADDEGQSTSGINGEFLHAQLLIDCLTRMEPTPTDRDELIGICRREYQGNDAEMKILHEFENDYVPTDALWWYTRPSFVYRLVNKALRVQNTDLLFLCRFFIRDLAQQLTDNQYKSCSSIRVYRGQIISQLEIEMLKNSIGQFISINSFLSTSINRELAHLFLSNSNLSPEYQRVLFEIDADPNLQNIKPFGKISLHSYFREEDEVLFMLGSIFQLVFVDCHEDGIWRIRMNLSSEDDHQLKSLLTYLKSQSKDKEMSLMSFANVLRRMGKFDDAEKYYHRYLHKIPSDQKSLDQCYYSLGIVAIEKDDLNSSLELLNKSLEIKRNYLDSNDPLIAKNYNSIGIAYRKKGDLDQAIEMFERALTIWKKTLGDRSFEVAKSYANIGNAYQRKQMLSKALECHLKAMDIHREYLPKYHPTLGSSHVNLATVYRTLSEYDRSLEHANQALKIFKQSLPATHSKIAWVLENMGLIYEKQDKMEESLSYLNKALTIYQQALPSTHYFIADVQRNIQRVTSRLYQ